MAQLGTAERPSSALRRALVPLALAQFICSFAGSNMNVVINDISKDLDTTVQGVLFTGVTSRARAFGAISAMGGIGTAAGPLLGGLITSAIAPPTSASSPRTPSG